MTRGKPLIASYAVANMIARESKSSSDGEYIKVCIGEVVKIMCPDKLPEFKKIFPELRRFFVRQMALFGSTYTVEQLFPRMKTKKCPE